MSEKLNKKRWCDMTPNTTTGSNFERMYDDIYYTMAKAEVSTELDDWVHQDREGNIVSEDEPKRFDRATTHIITHPKQAPFVDEVEANTSQKQGANIGGRKLGVACGTRPHE
jgi:hypothetical protein